MPIFSQFGKIVWQRLFNMVRILQTTALNAYGNISWQFWKFRNYKDLYGKPCKCDWMAKVVFLKQMLPTFGGRCNRYFWDIGLKILTLPNFNMLFQLVLAKFFKKELFSCLPKVDHLIKSCKEPIEITGHLIWTVTLCIPLPDKVNRMNAPLSILGHFICTLNLDEE